MKKKVYSVRNNGYTLQCYVNGKYLGSVSKKKLCELVLHVKNKN